MITLLRFLRDGIETLVEGVGRLTAWLVLCMVLLIAYDVIMRYLFNVSNIAIQELEWHFFSLIFLLGAAYTLKHDGHVRVDILYQSHWVSERGRAWINLLGHIFLLLPFCLLVIQAAYPWVDNAYIRGEISPDPGGLPSRWLLKSAIIVGFSLLLLQGIANLIHQTLFLAGFETTASTIKRPEE
ncbi:TRAP transporter small permease subunit [Candidatus Venteria ishoeyi]|uniref:TRAP transporter small permease subunit n=1 Tax=Candidatus Venteria ishoeyi TaxID=1899563 RepID=UPI00255CA3D7|nr:TRAP transporter small permease subunit [Candidatus Venteria ishoeyi]MDM8546468.1 TRAP transporter small permease subunit [Candidatus Venteria ishoeyi]